MTNAELLAKIKAEIERQRSMFIDDEYYTTLTDSLDEILEFLDKLEKDAKYKVRNPIFDECVANVDQKVREEVRENIDFEQALYDHFGQVKDFTLGMRIGKYFYELGCTRTAEQFEKNRLAACDNMSKEEYDRETDFVDSIIKNEHRQPTFSDAINYGMRLQKEQDEKDIIALIESRLSEIIGDAQPKPALRAELQELIKRLKEEKK